MLETKQVGRWTVSQAGMREAVRRMTLLKRVQERHERGELDDEELTALAIYPNIAGCVSPQLTEAEFFETPEQDLDALTSAAMELNPHWFAVPESVEEEKKSDAKPPASSGN